MIERQIIKDCIVLFLYLSRHQCCPYFTKTFQFFLFCFLPNHVGCCQPEEADHVARLDRSSMGRESDQVSLEMKIEKGGGEWSSHYCSKYFGSNLYVLKYLSHFIGLSMFQIQENIAFSLCGTI